MSATETNYLKTLFCPVFANSSKSDTIVAMGLVNYAVTVTYSNSVVNVIRPPFGYWTWKPPEPMKLTAVAQFGALTDLWAVSDVDQALIQGNWVCGPQPALLRLACQIIQGNKLHHLKLSYRFRAKSIAATLLEKSRASLRAETVVRIHAPL